MRIDENCYCFGGLQRHHYNLPLVYGFISQWFTTRLNPHHHSPLTNSLAWIGFLTCPIFKIIYPHCRFWNPGMQIPVRSWCGSQSLGHIRSGCHNTPQGIRSWYKWLQRKFTTLCNFFCNTPLDLITKESMIGNIAKKYPFPCFIDISYLYFLSARNSVITINFFFHICFLNILKVGKSSS